MAFPQYVDISSFQPSIVDWSQYIPWSAAVDGVPRLAARATEGVGFGDTHYSAYAGGFRGAAGNGELKAYCFARPDLNNPTDEVAWLAQVLGNTGGLRSQDTVMLDMEVSSLIGGWSSIAAWSLAWLQAAQSTFNRVPVIYASTSFIASFLQDTRLAQFPLIEAQWNGTTNPPPAPYPWGTLYAWQYTDNLANVPGFGGANVDADFIIHAGSGGSGMGVPSGWSDDGTTLTAPNGHKVVFGFRDHILGASSWDGGNTPMEEEYHANPVLLHNTGVGDGQRQVFRDTFLWYTSAAGVVQEPYIGWELDVAYNQINNLNGQLSNANNTLSSVQSQLSNTQNQLSTTQAQLASVQQQLAACQANGSISPATQAIINQAVAELKALSTKITNIEAQAQPWVQVANGIVDTANSVSTIEGQLAPLATN